MQFEGEHLLYGKIGHLLVIIATVCSLLSVISFFAASRKNDTTERLSWLHFGRINFMIHSVCLFCVFIIVFIICKNHYFEYMYAFKHASKELENKYLLACIWEGQEGSFLLWMMWHAVLGIFIISKTKKNLSQPAGILKVPRPLDKNISISSNEWKAPVMTILGLAQFFLCLMILGVYVKDVRLGNSLFSLTRNEIDAPIFSQPNYLSLIKDGQGLNVLLRNYWMVIHPPILFLGFASTIIPFAFAYAGLQTKRYGEWVKPALPWTLFSAAVLGVGIMMGGKWAYESLSFGGYWAWDPVENASLVPWLILIAGIHTMLIYNSTQRALRASYLFAILSFSFVLYSTFLTRTGILGDASVHSFTEAGIAINIMIGLMVALFSLSMLAFFFIRYRKIPAIHSEESIQSREFWMFIGSVIFFLSAIFIIGITSIPVYNKTPVLKSLILKYHGGKMALPEDPEFLYNKVMVIAAFIIGLLTAISQYFKYKDTPGKHLRKLIIPTIATILFFIAISISYPFLYDKKGAGFLLAIYMAFFASVYSIIANGYFILDTLKNKFKQAGGSIAHIGFALMIAGMLISSSNKIIISDSKVNGINLKMGIDPITKKQDNPSENLTLLREVPASMGEYNVMYMNDSSGNEKGRKFYKLLFENKKDKKETFVVMPDIYIMKDNNMSSNPDTRSYLTKDIFTYITYAIDKNKNTDTSSFNVAELREGEKSFYNNGYFILNKVEINPSNDKYTFSADDKALMADLSFVTKDSLRFNARPLIKADSTDIVNINDTIFSQNLIIQFAGVTENKTVKIGIKEPSNFIDFIAVKSFIFPYINLVWLGLTIMAIGIIISMIKRFGFGNTTSAVILIAASLGIFYMFLLAG
jgi:cytochrome c-type biogenesis protein CcmF